MTPAKAAPTVRMTKAVMMFSYEMARKELPSASQFRFWFDSNWKIFTRTQTRNFKLFRNFCSLQQQWILFQPICTNYLLMNDLSTYWHFLNNVSMNLQGENISLDQPFAECHSMKASILVKSTFNQWQWIWNLLINFFHWNRSLSVQLDVIKEVLRQPDPGWASSWFHLLWFFSAGSWSH